MSESSLQKGASVGLAIARSGLVAGVKSYDVDGDRRPLSLTSIGKLPPYKP